MAPAARVRSICAHFLSSAVASADVETQVELVVKAVSGTSLTAPRTEFPSQMIPPLHAAALCMQGWTARPGRT